jgi:adenosylhomocysteinase
MAITASKRKAAPKARAIPNLPEYDVHDLGLAGAGRKRIEWADRQMPVLRNIRDRFAREMPLKGERLGACLHITCETANLLRALKAGGAEIFACASNPLSTQDDVAAALVKDYDIPVYAIHGEDRDTYYSHLRAVLERRPTITMDDGADLVSLLHTEYKDRAEEVRASMEETTTGVIRLRAMEKDHAPDQTSVRQPLWHRSIDARRDYPRDWRSDRGFDPRRGRLWMVWARYRAARPRPWR